MNIYFGDNFGGLNASLLEQADVKIAVKGSRIGLAGPRFSNNNILTEKGKNFKNGIRILNKSGTIIGVNKAFCSLFDFEEKEIIGKLYSSVYNQNNNEDLEELLVLFRKNLLKPNIDYYFEKFIIFTAKIQPFLRFFPRTKLINNLWPPNGMLNRFLMPKLRSRFLMPL